MKMYRFQTVLNAVFGFDRNFFRFFGFEWFLLRFCGLIGPNAPLRSTIVSLTRFVCFCLFFFYHDSAFYNVGGRQSRDLCFNGFLSQAIGLFHLR